MVPGGHARSLHGPLRPKPLHPHCRPPARAHEASHLRATMRAAIHGVQMPYWTFFGGAPMHVERLTASSRHTHVLFFYSLRWIIHIAQTSQTNTIITWRFFESGWPGSSSSSTKLRCEHPSSCARYWRHSRRFPQNAKFRSSCCNSTAGSGNGTHGGGAYLVACWCCCQRTCRLSARVARNVNHRMSEVPGSAPVSGSGIWQIQPMSFFWKRHNHRARASGPPVLCCMPSWTHVSSHCGSRHPRDTSEPLMWPLKHPTQG